MSKSNRNKVVIINESVVGSIVKDIVTFGSILLSMWFNHHFLSGNGWIDAMFTFIMIVTLGRLASTVYNGPIDGAIKWLEENRNESNS